MKRFAIACVAVMGLMVAGSSMANAGYGFSFGHGGHYGGHGGHGSFYGGHGYTPHYYGHGSSHLSIYPSYGTFGYGHVDVHHGGHVDVHYGGHYGH